MTRKTQVRYTSNNLLGFLACVLIGGLAGAVTMLLMAPQSGEDTRSQIQEKSIELRDRTAEMVEEAMSQIRAERKRLTHAGRDKAKELIEQGQALVVEQLDHVSEAAQSGKKALQNA